MKSDEHSNDGDFDIKAFRSEHLREANLADVDSILDVLISTKEASLSNIISDHDRDRPFWADRWLRYIRDGSSAQHSLGDGTVLLYERDNRVSGFAAYHHTTRHGINAELQAVYVLKEELGQGLGTKLVETIGKRLYLEGARSMCVCYDPRNPYKQFYLKLGAVEIDPNWAIWRDLSRFNR